MTLAKGVREGGKLKVAVSFEPEVFQYIRLEAEDRGMSFSAQVEWLVKRCWKLEEEVSLLREYDKKRDRELKDLERRNLMKIRREMEARR